MMLLIKLNWSHFFYCFPSFNKIFSGFSISHTSNSVIVKSLSSLLVSMFLPPSYPIPYPGLFAHDPHFPSPLNGSPHARNSPLISFAKLGPK